MTFTVQITEQCVGVPKDRQWYWELCRLREGAREKFVDCGYKSGRTEAVDAAAEAMKEALAGKGHAA